MLITKNLVRDEIDFATSGLADKSNNHWTNIPSYSIPINNRL